MALFGDLYTLPKSNVTLDIVGRCLQIEQIIRKVGILIKFEDPKAEGQLTLGLA